jgi:hypothetical protein
MRPATLAEVARRTLADAASFGPALGEFLDEFYLHAGRRAAAIAEPPPALGHAVRDAMLGAVGEHLARRWGLAIPAWTEDPARFLKRPYFDSPIENWKARLIVQSPIAFRRRMIFTEAEPLRRARMPAG